MKKIFAFRHCRETSEYPKIKEKILIPENIDYFQGMTITFKTDFSSANQMSKETGKIFLCDE